MIRIIDSYLEHARIWYFYAGGHEDMYLSSADWMRRNLNRRIETAVPIFDQSIKNEILSIISLQLQDNVKACYIDENLENHYVQSREAKLRSQRGTKEFRDLVGEIATLLCYEATRDLPLEEVEIETPITMAKTKVLAGRKLALVPILRAGMGMLDGMLTLLPAAKVGFIGLYRDEETLQPVEYFCKLPQDIAERDVLVLDPMLATGGSAIDAITQIKKHGAKRIKFIGLIAAPEGIKALHEAHPDVDIYLGAEDDHLNENGYIVPGLGDAGDRIYGTK